MYDQLPILLRLQEIDDRIDRLESRKAVVPQKLQALEAELAKYRERLQVKNGVLEELQKKRRSKDRQLSLHQSQMEKYKSQRLSIKSNKEYAALELEIGALAAEISAVEDEILELMISIDEADDELAAVRDEVKAQEDIFNKKKEELFSEIRELDQQIAEWVRKRGFFVDQIDAPLLSRYTSWRKRRGSSMVAVIEGQSCGGCHLTLPPQLINEVRKKEQLYTCNSCGRVLYWRDEEEVTKSEE